jgi:hypothetical protein
MPRAKNSYLKFSIKNNLTCNKIGTLSQTSQLINSIKEAQMLSREVSLTLPIEAKAYKENRIRYRKDLHIIMKLLNLNSSCSKEKSKRNLRSQRSIKTSNTRDWKRSRSMKIRIPLCSLCQGLRQLPGICKELNQQAR